jgi:hypothetical protein
LALATRAGSRATEPSGLWDIDLEITADPNDIGFLDRIKGKVDDFWEERRNETEEFRQRMSGQDVATVLATTTGSVAGQKNDNSVTAITDTAEATCENESPTTRGDSSCAIRCSSYEPPILTAQETAAEKAGE